MINDDWRRFKICTRTDGFTLINQKLSTKGSKMYSIVSRIDPKTISTTIFWGPLGDVGLVKARSDGPRITQWGSLIFMHAKNAGN